MEEPLTLKDMDNYKQNQQKPGVLEEKNESVNEMSVKSDSSDCSDGIDNDLEYKGIDEDAKTEFDVFISYRREGGFETANHLAEKLKNDGYNVSLDIHSLKSGKFNEQLLENIDECTDFIVILDKNVFKRTLNGTPFSEDWLRRELAHAIKKNKNIIPVMLYGFKWPNKKLPEDINKVKEYNGLKYSRDYFDTGFYSKLKDFLQKKTEKERETTKQPVDTDKGRKPTRQRVEAVKESPLHEKPAETDKTLKLMEKPVKKPKKYKWLLPISLGVIVSTLLLLFFLHIHSTTLLLVGGGSLKGFFKYKNHLDITKSSKYVYVPMPSLSAWSLIREELSAGRYDDSDLRSYLLVLLSAKQATDKDFMPDIVQQNDFRNKIGFVVEIEVGADTLQVTMKNIEKLSSFATDKHMTIDSLASLIKDSQNNSLEAKHL